MTSSVTSSLLQPVDQSAAARPVPNRASNPFLLLLRRPKFHNHFLLHHLDSTIIAFINTHPYYKSPLLWCEDVSPVELGAVLPLINNTAGLWQFWRLFLDGQGLTASVYFVAGSFSVLFRVPSVSATNCSYRLPLRAASTPLYRVPRYLHVQNVLSCHSDKQLAQMFVSWHNMFPNSSWIQTRTNGIWNSTCNLSIVLWLVGFYVCAASVAVYDRARSRHIQGVTVALCGSFIWYNLTLISIFSEWLLPYYKVYILYRSNKYVRRHNPTSNRLYMI
jgi:hypothetical protein